MCEYLASTSAWYVALEWLKACCTDRHDHVDMSSFRVRKKH